MGFASLQHIKDSRFTCRGLCLPATFRLQGLVTLLTVYSLESRAGFLSHRQRSWDSPFGGLPLSSRSCRRFRRKRTCIPLIQLVGSVAEAIDRPAEPRFPGPFLPRVLGDRDGILSPRPPAPPLGFAPSGPAAKALARTSPGLLSRASRNPGDYSPSPPAPQSINRPSLRLARRSHRSATPAKATLVGSSHLPAPEH